MRITLAGALFGSLFPFWNGGGAPGNSIGAGLGGLVALTAVFAWHRIRAVD